MAQLPVTPPFGIELPPPRAASGSSDVLPPNLMAARAETEARAKYLARISHVYSLILAADAENLETVWSKIIDFTERCTENDITSGAKVLLKPR